MPTGRSVIPGLLIFVACMALEFSWVYFLRQSVSTEGLVFLTVGFLPMILGIVMFWITMVLFSSLKEVPTRQKTRGRGLGTRIQPD
jgi:hypothetical protein